jgi:hypothetical protein
MVVTALGALREAVVSTGHLPDPYQASNGAASAACQRCSGTSKWQRIQQNRRDPKLLDLLVIESAIVNTDTMGRQSDIADRE